MTQRPRTLSLYALVAAGIALSLPVQIFILFELNFSDINLVWDKLTWMNYLMGSSLLTLGVAAWMGSPRLLIVATVNTFLVAANNYFVGKAAVNYQPSQAILGTFLFAVYAYTPYLVPSVRRVLMNPRLRWWRSDTRQSLRAPIQVMNVSSAPISEVLAFDISRSGMFIQAPVGDFYGLKVGDRISVKWMNQTHDQIERDATVVRTTEARGKYPQGLGLKFDQAVSASGF